jgi:hypothetical protein
MLSGGYYTVDLAPQLGLIVINSMFFSVLNTADLATASTQLSWLESVLSLGSKKYLISMHIPPSLFYFRGLEDFWQQTYKDIFYRVLTDY